MERRIGTISMGVRAPIIREGDDIVTIVCNSVLQAAKSEGRSFRNRDIVAVTEAVVARAQGNYASVDHIAQDIRQKFPSGTFGVIFPILSRNRFSVCLKGIARGAKSITLMLSYPADEVGNHLISIDDLDDAGIDPYTDVLSEAAFRRRFGHKPHEFTGVDYIDYYKQLVREQGADIEIILANRCRTILDYTSDVLFCDVHTRGRTRRMLKAAGGANVLGLEDIMTNSITGSGYNPEYGLLGSNKATEDSVKLFPRDSQPIVEGIQKRLEKETGCHIEVMVYGDGAFKDPVGKIWELADPVVAPAYTKGLEGQPSEVKLKYLADNEFAHLKGDALEQAIAEYIRHKGQDLVGEMVSQGTTPRRLTDLIGSLCDLTSGSGDKGTPVVWIQGYFDNFTA